MSLIATGHSSGPIRIDSASSASTTTLIAARRCRENRRHASRQGEKRRLRWARVGATSTIGDAWVKPAIDDVGQQVEKNDETGEHERYRHDDGRVIGKDRADQKRTDPGNSENLVGDDGAAKHARHL